MAEKEVQGLLDEVRSDFVQENRTRESGGKEDDSQHVLL